MSREDNLSASHDVLRTDDTVWYTRRRERDAVFVTDLEKHPIESRSGAVFVRGRLVSAAGPFGCRLVLPGYHLGLVC